MLSPELSIKDLKEVVNKLASVKHKWFEIGIQLGMSNEDLKRLPDHGHQLHEVLEIWLRGGTTVLPIWSSLADALKSPDVDKSELGEAIQRQYCWLEQGKETM